MELSVATGTTAAHDSTVTIEIGAQLKEARLAKGISLEHIRQETKISRTYLEALEAGEFERLPPGDPYVKGFIRSYARAIGWDAGPAIERYNDLRIRAETGDRPMRLPKGRGLLHRVNQTLHWLGL